MSQDTESLSLSDKQRLELSLQVREGAIKDLTTDGQFPKDTGSRVFLLGLLDGLDRTIIQRAKIRSDESIAKQQQHISATIAGLLKTMHSKPRQVREDAANPPVLDGTYKIVDVVPGEMDTGMSNQTYEEFMKKQEIDE